MRVALYITFRTMSLTLDILQLCVFFRVRIQWVAQAYERSRICKRHLLIHSCATSVSLPVHWYGASYGFILSPGAIFYSALLNCCIELLLPFAWFLSWRPSPRQATHCWHQGVRFSVSPLVWCLPVFYSIPTRRVVYYITQDLSDLAFPPLINISNCVQARGFQHAHVRCLCSQQIACVSAVTFQFTIIYWYIIPFLFFHSLHIVVLCAKRPLTMLLLSSSLFYCYLCHCVDQRLMLRLWIYAVVNSHCRIGISNRI